MSPATATTSLNPRGPQEYANLSKARATIPLNPQEHAR
jgi:hypothetical protein